MATTTMSVRLPKELTKKLQKIADETERARSFHVQKALEAYLEDYADLQVALDRLRDPNDKTVSSSEMRKLLGL